MDPKQMVEIMKKNLKEEVKVDASQALEVTPEMLSQVATHIEAGSHLIANVAK